MEHIQDNQEHKRRGRPKKVVEDKPKGKRGRPSKEEIRLKYMTRRKGRPTKAESRKPRYIPVKERNSE